MGAQGTAVLDFGAFPGKGEATVDVTGQTGFTASSLAEAWVYPVATAEHSADEHIAEGLRVLAYFVANGQFRIVGWSESRSYGSIRGQQKLKNQTDPERLYGRYTVGWVWN